MANQSGLNEDPDLPEILFIEFWNSTPCFLIVIFTDPVAA